MAKPYLREDSAQINPLTRRQVITGSAAATAAAVIPTTAIAETVDPHHAWLEEWRVLNDLYAASNKHCHVVSQMNQLGDMIADTPALTREGMIAKVRFLREDSEDYARDMLDTDVIGMVLGQFETFLERLA